MKKRLFIPFGSEWFGIPISTLALAQVYLLIFGREHDIVYRYIGEGLTFTGLLIFAIIFVMWVVSSLSSRGKKYVGTNCKRRYHYCIVYLPWCNFLCI